ncbi:MAG: cobalamin biosynthesis protein CbiG, partial [Caulobacteraceae bacterium]
AVWDQLARMVKDRPDNVNNRFGVGSEINRRLTGGPFPFWGCPPRDALTTLQPRRGREHGAGDIPEFRHTEVAGEAASPVWKLYYNAAVGPQAILGIPMVRRLKLAAGAPMRIWPFETGFKALGDADLEGIEVVAAEISTSLAPAQPMTGEAKEAAQLRAIAEHLARLDEQGKLGALFAPAKTTAADAVVDAEREEGWTLGV